MKRNAINNALRIARQRKANGGSTDEIVNVAPPLGFFDRLFGKEQPVSYGRATPDQSWPSESDLDISRKYDQTYGNPVAPTLTEGAMIDRPSFAQAQSRYLSKSNDPNLQPVNQEQKDRLETAWLAANKTALGSLGFDPRHIASTPATKNPTTVAGFYKPENDKIWYNEKYPSTVVHESLHRGIQELKNVGKLPDWLKPDMEETLVRGMMLKHFNEIEMGRGEQGDKQIKWAKELMDPKGFYGGSYARNKGKSFPDMLTKLEALAATHLAEQRPRGPRANGGRAYPLDKQSNWSENADYQKTGGHMTRMSPDAFLKKVEPLDMDKKDKKAVKKFKKEIKSGKKSDPAAIYPEGGQDGRHHAMAAKKLAIKKMPVITWPKKADGGDVEWLSTSEKLVDDGKVNWGDPSQSSDFVRAAAEDLRLHPEKYLSQSINQPVPTTSGSIFSRQLPETSAPVVPQQGSAPLSYAPERTNIKSPALSAIETNTSPFEIKDISHLSDYRGQKMENPQAVVFHHTAGRGTPEGVVNTLNTRVDPFTGRRMVLGTNYIIDRDGSVYSALPPGMTGAHILPSKTENLSNANTIGVEVIAKDNSDLTPAQIQAGQQLHSYLSSGMNKPLSVYGHGELNPGHKMADEGLAIVNPIRKSLYKKNGGSITERALMLLSKKAKSQRGRP